MVPSPLHIFGLPHLYPTDSFSRKLESATVVQVAANVWKIPREDRSRHSFATL